MQITAIKTIFYLIIESYQTVVEDLNYLQSRRERGGWGTPPPTPPPPFPGAKFFFPRKIETHKIFTCEEYMRLEFIY